MCVVDDVAGSFDKKASIPDDKASWLKAWDITDKKIQDELVEIVKTDDGIVGTYYKRCIFADQFALPNYESPLCVPKEVVASPLPPPFGPFDSLPLFVGARVRMCACTSVHACAFMFVRVYVCV